MQGRGEDCCSGSNRRRSATWAGTARVSLRSWATCSASASWRATTAVSDRDLAGRGLAAGDRVAELGDLGRDLVRRRVAEHGKIRGRGLMARDGVSQGEKTSSVTTSSRATASRSSASSAAVASWRSTVSAGCSATTPSARDSVAQLGQLSSDSLMALDRLGELLGGGVITRNSVTQRHDLLGSRLVARNRVGQRSNLLSRGLMARNHLAEHSELRRRRRHGVDRIAPRGDLLGSGLVARNRVARTVSGGIVARDRLAERSDLLGRRLVARNHVTQRSELLSDGVMLATVWLSAATCSR